MAIINPYLNFKGNCKEAFNFYRSVFGGEFCYLGRCKDMAAHEGTPPVSKEMEDKILHVSLPISKETVLMGSDTTDGEWEPNFVQGNNISLQICTESKEETDRVFIALSEGGGVIMPMAFAFWGDYFGMLTDKFGINWMINFNPEQ
ncbi:MAG: VOC family protein [Candidatus Cloacimonetes bacterium]|nr:VOC family protein [Candidatus Cloacimonadota bacterium]